jgi:hypothetical protein
MSIRFASIVVYYLIMVEIILSKFAEETYR